MNKRIITGKTHSYRVPDQASLYFIDELGKPLAQKNIYLVFENGREMQLQTDAYGCLPQVLQNGRIRELKIEGVHEVDFGNGICTDSGTHLPRDQ